jgi:DNA polymerase-3 subunit alpha
MISRFEPHSHTDFSNFRLLDSINKVENLIDQAIDLGLSGIAITDHETLSSHMRANLYQKEINKNYPNFKIALGNEIYLTETRDK